MLLVISKGVESKWLLQMVCKFSELFETPCTYESFKHGTHRCLCYFLNVASKVIQKRISGLPQRINWLRGQFLITWGRCKQETDNRRRTRKQMTHKQQHLTSAHVTRLHYKLLVDIESSMRDSPRPPFDVTVQNQFQISGHDLNHTGDIHSN